MKSTPLKTVAVVSAALAAAGCVASREEQLASVAKDWSLTIRASQVIPVYPMNEDLLVGDVFLVQSTTEQQHEQYLKKGFMPLGNHIARLQPSRYDDTYGHSFFKNAEIGSVMPRQWLTPGDQTSFDRAPGAAFPSYTFAVSSSQGLAGMLPVQGVPVGLSLMNTQSATGSVTLKDARTYGIPMADLLTDVQAWAADPSNKDMLALYAPAADGERVNYVRVVSRVYLVGKVNVTLSDTQGSGGGLSVGAPKPVELPLLQAAASTDPAAVNKATTDAYNAGLSSINKSLEAAAGKDSAGNVLPGGTVKVVAASSKSVSIDETFRRPVPIGYLGFDMAILAGGLLGPPCPTYAVLEHGAAPQKDRNMPVYAAAMAMRDIGTFRAVSAIASMSGDRDKARATQIVNAINASAASVLPATYPVSIWSEDANGQLHVQHASGAAINRQAGPYRALSTYAAALRASEAVLAPVPDSNAASAQQRADLAATRTELERIAAVAPAIKKQLQEAAVLLFK